ncbi:MerR family DNA-binding transcriptional regulator [Petroclostridium xylanilyticum]|uniref:MerR family DNA-binding transcriptional regulator n=1 Tax=Petroclostridium xylanilyticum TaxID=1792311 RepID=UPI000B993901|nr:MerR family transcriptional regulator [Petroclostridium xylanilyticum]
MKYYTIHEFSKLVGKTPQTLRNWDKKGLLIPHHTGANGYRYYSHDQLKQVLNIKKDRLLRFGFELVEYISNLYGCEIEVIDSTEKTEQQELVEDLVQIITVFSCKLQGKRANKARKMIEELTEDDKDN